MKYIDADLLRKEVKKYEKAANKSALGCADSETRSFYRGKDFAYQYVGILIDALQQEHPEVDLDKIDMIRAELKRRREDILSKVHHYPIHRIELLDDLLSFLDTLEAEEDFDDVAHYTKVREIKTGKEFWAEYSTESAEWYEADTGNAYSISDVEIVKEQQEVDLEKEYEQYVTNDPVYSILVNSIAGMAIARHFYELGKNSK